SGVVTLTQLQAIDHTTTSTYNGAYIDDTTAILGSGKIDLVASAYTTDSEGDKSATASAALDLGGNVKFGDDGPKVTLTIVGGAQLVLDESVGTTGSVLNEGGRQNNDETLSVESTDIGYATISAANLFSISVQGGADGENAGARAYSLTLGGNTTTALQDS